MTIIRTAATMAFTVVLALSALAPEEARAQACSNVLDNAATSQALAMVNQQRAAARLPAVATSSALTQAALRHACDMTRSGLRGHQGSDGSTPRDRVARAGYRSCLTAENIAWGQRDVVTVLNAWVASPPHLANIRQQRVQHIGLAQVGSGNASAWVMVLARPC